MTKALLDEPTEAMSPLPKDDPRLVAWEAYRAGPSYANTRNWALHEKHVDGSLWAAFVAGCGAMLASAPQEPDDVERVAHELHDAVFAHCGGMPSWDGLTVEKRKWFRNRARRLLGGRSDPLRQIMRQLDGIPDHNGNPSAQAEAYALRLTAIGVIASKAIDRLAGEGRG